MIDWVRARQNERSRRRIDICGARQRAAEAVCGTLH